MQRFKILNNFTAKSRKEARKIMNDIEPLKLGELVHHINGNPLDNSRKNLIVLNHKQHYTHHVKGGGLRPRKSKYFGQIKIKLKTVESLLYLYNEKLWL